MTSEISVRGILAVLSVQLGMFAALLLMASGVHKLIGRERARTAMAKFAGVPDALAPLAAIAIAMTELLAAVLLLLPSCRVQGAMLAALIWTVYLALMLRAIADGRLVDCGCSFGAAHGSLGMPQVTRNAALAGIAIFVASVAAAGAAVPMSIAQLPAALALLALYGALDQVMALQPPRAGELL